LRAPEFWHKPGSPLAGLLAPLGLAYDAAGRVRRALIAPVRVERPIVCVGNVTVGGAGKTPIVLALARWLEARGLKPHLLTRGYGGSAAGPLKLDAQRHGVAEVGDEALLLAEAAPTWLAHDRVEGARAAIRDGAELVIMDDGFQNPGLAKDLALLAIDGEYGFGNGHVLPAGPLREPLGAALARAQGAVLVGVDKQGLGASLARRVPVLEAELVPDEAARAALQGKRVLAFAGIGRPEKFFATLEGISCTLVRRVAFPDHHVFARAELVRLLADAEAQEAIPVTTAKDFVRIAPDLRAPIAVLPVTLVFRDEDALAALLNPLLARHG